MILGSLVWEAARNNNSWRKVTRRIVASVDNDSNRNQEIKDQQRMEMKRKSLEKIDVRICSGNKLETFTLLTKDGNYRSRLFHTEV